MHIIGKINKNIYKCVTEDITTEEVIITDNQINHIKNRHPNDYENFSSYFSDILSDPDFILEANKPNTAFILKQITENDLTVQLILRLQTSQDPKGYKNSIITFLKIDIKTWNKYLRNKKSRYNNHTITKGIPRGGKLSCQPRAAGTDKSFLLSSERCRRMARLPGDFLVNSKRSRC